MTSSNSDLYVTISAVQLHYMLGELERLRAQVTELQARGTQLVEANRDLVERYRRTATAQSQAAHDRHVLLEEMDRLNLAIQAARFHGSFNND